MLFTTFIHQKNYEHVVAKVRRHFITFIPTIILFVLLSSLPIILQLLFSTLFPTILAINNVHLAALLLASIYYLSLLLFFYTEFVAFYLDILIITNDRLIDVNQHSLFSRSIAEMDLYQTQDVISEVKGFWASFFKYGTITVQNASGITKFQALNVPHPDKLREIILDLANEDRKFHVQEELTLPK